MEREQSLEKLIAARDRLIHIRDQRQNHISEIKSERDDFSGVDPLEQLRLFRRSDITARLGRSITQRLSPHISEIEQQIEEHLPELARNYRDRLTRAERDLRSLRRSRFNRGLLSEEEFGSYEQAVRELGQKPQHDSLLARALGIDIKKPETPAAPTPPVEHPVSPPPPEAAREPEEKRRIESLKEAIRLQMGNPDNFILPYTLTGKEQNPLDVRIEELNLDVRSYNALKKYVIYTVGEILSINFNELMNIRNLGERAQNDILEALIRFGVSVKPETKEPEPEFMEVFLDAEKSTVRIDQSPEVVLHPIEFALMNYMKQHSTEQVTHESLKAAVGNLSKSRNPVARNMWGIEKKLGQKIFQATRGGHSSVWQFIRPLKPTESKEAEPALPVLPEMRINMTTYQVEIDGRSTEVSNKIDRAILTNFEDILGRRYTTKSRIRELLKELGIDPRFPAGLAIRNLNRTFGSPLITEVDPDKYILNANVTFVGEEATKKEQVSAEKRKRYQEGYLKFTKILPDGQVIEIQGKILSECFDEIFKGSKDNPISSDSIRGKEAVSPISRLRKILEPYGWTIIQPVPLQERAKGKTGVYYPEKIVKEEGTRLPDVEIPTEEPITIEKLQAELEELQAKRSGIANKVDRGLLDRHWLDEIDEEISRREAELRLRTLKPEHLEEGETAPIGVQIREIPYEPTEEEKRSFRETALLSFIVTIIQANKPLLFEGIQAAMVPESRRRKGVQINILQSRELKEVFQSALRKIREEAETTNLKDEWNEDEERLWEQLQDLIRNISGGDVKNFIRSVGRMIDDAEKRFYKYFPQSGKVYKLTL